MARIALVLTLALLVIVVLAGCSESPPDADFTASFTTGYVPVTIQFTDMTQGDVTGWAWDFNNDKLVDSTVQNPQYNYTAPGVYTIILRATGPGGSDIETKTDYLQLAPTAETIYAVSPSSGLCGETLDLVVTGENLAGASGISLGDGITVDSFSVDTPSQITANVTISLAAAPVTRDVVVTLPSGTSILSGGFTTVFPNLPTVTGVNPNTADRASTQDFIISGANFDIVNGVDFGEGITINSFTVDSPTQITTNISVAATAPATSRDVLIANPGGNGVLTDGFTVTTPSPPVVTEVMPGIGSRGEALKVVIKGTSFWGASEVFVRSGTGVTVNNFTVDAKNQITATISISNSAGIGSRDISVTTPGGTGTITDGFEIVGVSPSSGSRGSTLSVVITGTGFTEASELSFGEGIFVNSFTVDSPTQITAGISVAMTATPGPRDITVTTPVGSQIIASSFTVAQPICTTGFTANRTTGTGTTTVKFTDTSSGDITGWAWDFNGDGKTDSIEKNPSYTYNRNGNYTVTLTVSGPHCENTLTKQSYIKISGCST